MHHHGIVIACLLGAFFCFLFARAFESLVARFVDFWMPALKDRSRARMVATIGRRVYYGATVFFLIAAIRAATF